METHGYIIINEWWLYVWSNLPDLEIDRIHLSFPSIRFSLLTYIWLVQGLPWDSGDVFKFSRKVFSVCAMPSDNYATFPTFVSWGTCMALGKLITIFWIVLAAEFSQQSPSLSPDPHIFINYKLKDFIAINIIL